MADCAIGTPSSVLIPGYVRLAFDEFDELAGDCAYADDKAIVGGIARLDGRPPNWSSKVVNKEKIRRNFGMPAPEGTAKHCVDANG